MTSEQYLVAAIGGLCAALGSLSYAVRHLYKRQTDLHNACEAERKKCEDTLQRVWERLTAFEKKLA